MRHLSFLILFVLFCAAPLLRAADRIEVARGKFASQAGEWANLGILPASYAIDGDFKSYSHTGDPVPWWQVNLGGNYAISSIELFARSDNVEPNTLADVSITVLVPDAETVVYRFLHTGAVPPQPGSSTIEINPPVSGQYIRIERGDFIVAIGELKVMASPTQPAYAGPVTKGPRGEAGLWSVAEVTDNGPLRRMDMAVKSLNGTTGLRRERSLSTINFYGLGTNHGNFATGESAFLASATAQPPNVLVQDLALSAKGHILIPASQGGDYTFSVWADDSFELLVDGKIVCSVDGTNSAQVILPVPRDGLPFPSTTTPIPVYTNGWAPNVLGSIHLEPGVHSVELVYFQSEKFSHLELAAAKGLKTAFDASFKLVGDAASGGLQLVSAIPPTITRQPQSRKAKYGESVSFTVEASGSSALTCQWFLDGEAIPGATDFSLSMDAERSGIVEVEVQNWAGKVQSDGASLEVQGSSEDTDADGLSDQWELDFFSNLDSNGDADPDGDGYVNRSEYGADTSPVDQTSLAKITAIERVESGMKITWKGGQNSRHILQRKTLARPGQDWSEVVVFDRPATDPSEYIDPAEGESSYVYRVLFQRL